MARDHVSNLQLLAGLMRVEVLARESLGHAKRPHTQRGRIAECGGDFVRQRRAEIVEIVVRAGISKRKNCDRRSMRQWLWALRFWRFEKPPQRTQKNYQRERCAYPQG